MTTVPSTGASEGSLIKIDRMGRMRFTREQREKILDAYETSGASGTDFAKIHGIKYQTLATWVQRRRRERRLMQSGGLEDEFLPPLFDVPGPAELSAFQTFCHTLVPGAVEVEDLDETAPFVGEQKGHPTGGIDLDGVAGEFGKPVEALALSQGSKAT